MPNVVVPQLDTTQHVVRSVRGWLHALFPEEYIWLSVKRPAAAPSRPAFRIEIISGPMTKLFAPGSFQVDTTLIIRYAATDMWDAYRKVDRIQSRALPPYGRIPMSLYNVDWPVVPVVTPATGSGTIPTGSYDVALVVEDVDGNRSAPTDRVSVDVTSGDELAVAFSAWPGKGLVRNALLYAALPGEPLHLQSTTPVDPTLHPTDLVELSLVSYNGAGTAPATNQRIPFSGLRVESTDSSVMELPEQEDVWDGLVTLRLRTYVQRVL